MWLAKSISRVATSPVLEPVQPFEHISLTDCLERLLEDLEGHNSCCYWDDRMVPPIQLHPHVLPISLSSKAVPQCAEHYKAVSFFLRVYLLIFVLNWLQKANLINGQLF